MVSFQVSARSISRNRQGVGPYRFNLFMSHKGLYIPTLGVDDHPRLLMVQKFQDNHLGF